MPDEVKQVVVAESEAPVQKNERTDQPKINERQDGLDRPGADALMGDQEGIGIGLESRQDLEDEFPDLSSIKIEETMAHRAKFQQLSISSSDRRSRGNIELLMDVKMPIAIELGRTEMAISEILALGPGSVVELEKLAGEPVDLLVNGKVVARGEVVVVDENFGVRITMLMSPQERLKSLAQ